MTKSFPVIDPVATGENIIRLRKARGLTVRDLQRWFGFEEPQAIYKWQKGQSLPSVDNLYALGVLLEVPMDQILVSGTPQWNMLKTGQQEISCCPDYLWRYRPVCPAVLNTAVLVACSHFLRLHGEVTLPQNRDRKALPGPFCRDFRHGK